MTTQNFGTYPFSFFDRDDARNERYRSYADFACGTSTETTATVAYLEASRAVRTPIEVFALWVELWQRQGGQVEGVFPDDFTATDSWMPTRYSGLLIPTTYGAAALNLVMVPHQIAQDLRATSGSTYSGWEYGHSTVRTFSAAAQGMMPVVNTNERFIHSYADVERMRLVLGPDAVIARGVEVLRQAYCV